jgi:hypothetical protein
MRQSVSFRNLLFGTSFSPAISSRSSMATPSVGSEPTQSRSTSTYDCGASGSRLS